MSKAGKIAYIHKGSGKRHFLIVHNSGGNHKMMEKLGDFLSSEHSVLIPDLLGHGQSDLPKIDYSIEILADTLLDLCKSSGLDEIIYIGLNYGANLGIELAQRNPKLISHLILLEPPIFMEPWIVEAVKQQIEDLHNYRPEWPKETVEEVILKTTPQNCEIARKALEMTPPHVKISTFEHLLKWDHHHTFNCELPTLLVQSSHPFCKEEKAREHFTNLQVCRVLGSGPWVNLEVPQQVHVMIERFLELTS